MTRRISIPGLARLCIAETPGEVIALGGEPGLLRGGEPTGPLVNRYVLGNIDRALRYGGDRLPSALPRDNAARATRQRALAAALDPARIDWATMPIAELAAYVTGDRSRALGRLCQQAAGRAFRRDYRATAGTWAAAETIDRAMRSLNPFTHLVDALTGRLRHAQRRLYEAADGDTFCMHATGIAVHTLAGAIERLRLAAADPETKHKPFEQVLAEAILAPASVVRHTAGRVDAHGQKVAGGTLVLLKAQAASEHTVDPRVTFMAGSWSACPADRFVPALVARVWQEATGATAPPVPYPVHSEPAAP